MIKAADTPGRVLIAGAGNIFLSDDGFGSEVARRLAGLSLPHHVRVVDYGIGGIHLAYDLLDGYEQLILVDAISRGQAPGTVLVMEVYPDAGTSGSGATDAAAGRGVDAHSMDPHTVLSSVQALGGTMPRTLVVGCEPAETGEGMGLSSVVLAAVDTAVSAVIDLLDTSAAQVGASGNPHRSEGGL